MRAPRRRSGFTLIEMIATVVLVGLVLGIATRFYVQISTQTESALTRTRENRHALSVLTRMQSDLEASYLLKKPEELDPLLHPWTFRGENQGSDLGADHLVFVTRNHRARTVDKHESDLAVVAYWLRPGAQGDFELMRWSSTILQDLLAFDFGNAEDDAVLLADGIASFGVQFLSGEGEWTDEWDSSLIADSSELPAGVEVALSLLERDAKGFVRGAATDDFGELLEDGVERRIYRRRVSIPVRPIDLQAMLEEKNQGEGEGDDVDGEDGDCITVSQCIAKNRELIDGMDASTRAQIQDAEQNQGGLCVSESGFAQVAAQFGCQ